MKLKEITYEQVLNHRKLGGEMLLIDIREEYEFEDGHLPGSINIPMDKVLNYLEINANKEIKIVIYCNTGRRSKPVVYMLDKMKNISAFNLMEGYKKLNEKWGISSAG